MSKFEFTTCPAVADFSAFARANAGNTEDVVCVRFWSEEHYGQPRTVFYTAKETSAEPEPSDGYVNTPFYKAAERPADGREPQKGIPFSGESAQTARVSGGNLR